jgi:hypothetical protein
MVSRLLPLWLCSVVLFASMVFAEDTEPESDAGKEAENVMKQVTITMSKEVLDERTILVRDNDSKNNIIIKLSNVDPPEQGSFTDEEHKERLLAGKAALEKLVAKSMMLWKAAPEEHQPQQQEGADRVVVADAWTINGLHLNTKMQKDGHLVEKRQYTSEFTGDILSAKAETSKKEAYKKLETALKENEKHEKKKKKEEAQKLKEQDEAEDVQPIGVGGMLGLGMLGLLVVGVFTNFGMKGKKKGKSRPKIN